METELTTAYVSLGSNLGNRAGNLLLAVRGLLEASFTINKLSAIYETEPYDVKNHGAFLNMVAEIHINNISASQMMARMLRIEYLLGRRNKNERRPRTVDLDLLLFGDYQCDTEFLILPHPRMHERRFVLTPLAEISPQIVHPGLQKNVGELLSECGDFSIVKRWNPNGKAALKEEKLQRFATSEMMD